MLPVYCAKLELGCTNVPVMDAPIRRLNADAHAPLGILMMELGESNKI